MEAKKMENDRIFWDRWLEEEKYISRLNTIRDAVIHLIDEQKSNPPKLRFYTPHGKEHCLAVENNFHKLIPGDLCYRLTERERFYLLASAWLHDLGMLNTVAEKVYQDFNIKPDEIRKKHHITSEQYIMEFWESLSIEERDRLVLSKLCLYHRKLEDIETCPEILPAGSGGESIRLRLLASYLRLADAFDVSESRTPAESYFIYINDMPLESKIHWIKHRILYDVTFDSEKKLITVFFKEPYTSDKNNNNNFKEKLIQKKIAELLEVVEKDLTQELQSVMSVLIRYELPTYINIEFSKVQSRIGRQMQNDLIQLALNFDFMMAPSSSRLLEMVLVSSANILGYSLDKEKAYIHLSEFEVIEDYQGRLQEFLDSIEKGTIGARPCHLGLVNLVKELNTELSRNINENDKRKGLIKIIKKKFEDHHKARNNIRKNSKALFKEQFICYAEKSINILLYGFSELATKTLCGFRDYLISLEIDKIDDCFHSHIKEIEFNVSKNLHIYICEGQPKTQTNESDKLTYHDGAQYALYLRDRNFNNLTLIPDLISSNLIDELHIDFVILGANGITNESFSHSAGHGAIIKFVKLYNDKKDRTEQTKIILSVSKEKYSPTAPPEPDTAQLTDDQSDSTYYVDGYPFKQMKGSVGRKTFWMTRDKKILTELKKADVKFFNPRQDTIPTSILDYIITDNDYADITNISHENFIKLFQ